MGAKGENVEERVEAEGFKGHVATDGSFLGNAGKWRACCWAVVQFDYDEEMGMYGSGPANHQEGGADGLFYAFSKV